MAAPNPHRGPIYRGVLSTKYTDDETGLVMYQLRAYSPGLGRFISRDRVGDVGGFNLYGFTGNDPANEADVLGNHAYSAYRQLGLPGGQLLWKMLHSAGHVYLAFHVADKTHKEISAEDECKWAAFLTKLGYKKSSTPISRSREYDEWITFSFHPDSVQNDDGAGNLVSTIITRGSFIDINNKAADLDPVKLGDAKLNLITSDPEQGFALFKRAEQSRMLNGSDFVSAYNASTFENDWTRKGSDRALVSLGGYGFLRSNCGSWAKYITGQTGLRWPLLSYLYNGGVGVDGPLAGVAKDVDLGVRTVYGAVSGLLEQGADAQLEYDQKTGQKPTGYEMYMGGNVWGGFPH